MEPHRGLEINERLRLVRPLAQGGMANLWVAEHCTLGIEVVVKALIPEVAQLKTARQRLMREARLTAKVSSPYVVRVLDFGTRTADDDVFLVMELLEGEDLAARIERRGQLSASETLLIVRHVALALEKAHAAGIIHRDVKPENVFVVETPGGAVAKLVDFGIAKDASEGALDLTCANAMLGTAPYMSPEQVVSARDVDARCDLWSLAVVAYACLMGQTPFGGETLGAVCVSIHRGLYEAPSRRRPELSPSVDAFFARALCPSIALRFQSARALYEAFCEAIVARGSAVGPGGPSDFSAAALGILDGLNEPRAHREPTGTEENMPIELATFRSGIRVKALRHELYGRVERGRR